MWKSTRENDIRDVGTNTNPTREQGAETLAFESVVHFRLPRLRVELVWARADRLRRLRVGLVMRVPGHLVGRDPHLRVLMLRSCLLYATLERAPAGRGSPDPAQMLDR